MNIDFNNVRKQAMGQFEQLTDRLNRSIIKDDTAYANSDNPKFYKNIDGYVLIEASDIQNQMDSLRNLIGTIAMTYQENDPEFKDVFDELHPNDGMISFNDKD